MARPSDETIIKAVKGTAGIMSTIAKRLNVDWHTAEKYVQAEPATMLAYCAEKEQVLDLGESSLIKAVKNGEAWAVKWLLATKGKERGYVERQEVTGKDGKDLTPNILTIEIVQPKEDD